MSINVYEELAIELVEECQINKFLAVKIIDYLVEIGQLDYDALKERYLEEEI